MQEINRARQESCAKWNPIAGPEEAAKMLSAAIHSAWESDEDESGCESRCRVCDGPVEESQLVCRECSDRDCRLQLQEWFWLAGDEPD